MLIFIRFTFHACILVASCCFLIGQLSVVTASKYLQLHGYEIELNYYLYSFVS